MSIDVPTMFGSAPNRRLQRPSEMTTTRCLPDSSCSVRKGLPRIGCTSSRKNARRNPKARYGFGRPPRGEGEVAAAETGNVRERARQRANVVQLQGSELHLGDVELLITLGDPDEL